MLFGGKKPASASSTNSSTPLSSPATFAALVTLCMLRPTRHTRRPAASAARITVSTRATFDANVVTATLPVCLATSSVSALRTVASEPDSPSSNTFVESQIIARTPSSPSVSSRSIAISSPSCGSASIFQSPVWNTSPSGVRIAKPCISGIECVIGTYSTLKGPASTVAPG